MAIEFGTTRIAAQTTAAATQSNAPAEGKAKTTPVLGGESLTVMSGAMSDLEKLVARLKNENENTRQSVTQRRISILGTVLDSMADRISEAERKSLIEIERLNGQKADAEGDLAGYKAEKTATEGRIAVLDAKIKALENAVKQAVEDGKDHNKQVEELERQRAEEQAELDRLNGLIASTNAKISGLDVKIAECTKTIAQTTLNEVANALRIAASGDAEPPTEERESNEDRVEKDKKEAATNIGNVISEALDKIDDQIRKALDENQVVKA